MAAGAGRRRARGGEEAGILLAQHLACGEEGNEPERKISPSAGDSLYMRSARALVMVSQVTANCLTRRPFGVNGV